MAHRKIIGPVPIEISEAESVAIEEKIARAEEDIAEMRVSMRWGKEQVEIIKRAADLIGVPYQTYVKEAAFRQAIADLTKIQAVVPDVVARSHDSSTG